jgi:hypothetical protein
MQAYSVFTVFSKNLETSNNVNYPFENIIG